MQKCNTEQKFALQKFVMFLPKNQYKFAPDEFEQIRIRCRQAKKCK